MVVIRVFWLFFSALASLRLEATPVEIVFWHSLAGSLGTELVILVEGFNRHQSVYEIKPIYKGNYIESLTSFAAAFRAKQAPALIQVFEVGTSAMLTPKGIIKAVDAVMHEAHLALPTDDFFPAVREKYSEQGQLMAMPLNISVPVLFYNADALKQVGYSSENFPKTWDSLEQLANKLHQAGFACAYTSAYPAWIFIESFSALHGLPMVNAESGQACYNNPEVIHHLERLVAWQRLHYFEYGGRSDEATFLFTSGRCPLMSQSSGSAAGLSQAVSFKVGMASLPMDQHASSYRHNNVTGGAALWVVAGQTRDVYQGIAAFIAYLATPSVQAAWHRQSGYLPLGASGLYQLPNTEKVQPSLQIAKGDWGKAPTLGYRVRWGAQDHVRAMNDEALEAIFSGMQSPQQAMDEAVRRANLVILRFKLNTG